MMVSESGTAAYPRVLLHTFGYRREVLLMYAEFWISSFETKADRNPLKLWWQYRWELLSLADVGLCLMFLHSFYPLDND